MSTGDGYEAPGKALQKLGEGVTSFALAFEKQQDELADFEGRNKYQAFVNEVDKRRREADVNVTGDGRGHTDRLDADSDTAFQRFIGENQHLPPRTQRRLQLQYGGDRNRFSTRSFVAEQNRIGPYFEEQSNTWFNTNIVPRLFETDPETGQPVTDRATSVNRAAAEIDRFIDGAPGMPPAVRERIRAEMAKRVYQAWQNSAGPDAAVERDRIVQGLRLEQDGVVPQDMYGEDARPARGNATGRPNANSDDSPVQFRQIPGNRTPRGARERRGSVEGIVLHHTAGTTLESAISQNQLAGTGYNYYVDREGEVYQFAPDNQRMVHIRNMGDQHRNGRFPNLGLDNTVGISAIARNEADITPAQREAMRKLTMQIARQHNIPRDNIIGHGDIQSNRETDEGAMAREFREGRLALGGPEDRATRVADSGAIRSDATAVAQAQPRTEDLVRRYIIENQVEIERFAEQRRRRLEVDERIEETRARRETHNDGKRMLANLEDRRARDGLTPGVVSEPDPSKPELTREWIEEQVTLGLLDPTAAGRLRSGLDPQRSRTPQSNTDVFRRLMVESRDASSLPQVVADRALDMFHRNLLTRRDYDAIVANVRRGAAGNRISTPPFVTDAFRELDRNIPLPARNASEADRTRYNDTLRKLNDYVRRGLEAGNLDPDALMKYVGGLADTGRRDGIRGGMERLQRLPKPRVLNVDPQSATIEHLTEASDRLRQELDTVMAMAVASPAGMTAMAPRMIEIDAQAKYLAQLHQILTQDHQRTNRGQSPQPSRSSAPSAPGAQPQGGQNRQEPTPPPAQPRQGQTPQPPQGRPTDGVLTRGPRTFRRIVRDADGNIEGMIEEPLP